MSIFKSFRYKDDTGKTTDYDVGAKASNVVQDSTHRFITDTERNTWNAKLGSTGDGSNLTSKFTQASSRANLSTGEKISESFGKIMKWFADLKAVAFSGSYNDLTSKPTIPSGAAASQAVANNCTTTAAGSVLDARQGKVLMDKANQLSSEINGINGKLYNDSITGTTSMSLKDAAKHVCDNYVGINSSARGRFNCAEGWYDYDLIKSADDYCSGFLSGHTQSAAYQVYRSRGADAVLKKLGSIAPGERLIRSNLSATTTINMAEYCTDISKVTINDFLFTIANINAYCTSWGHPSDKGGPATSNNFQPVSGSYNAETGMLTVTISVPTYGSGTYGQTGGGNCKITPSVNVYFFG